MDKNYADTVRLLLAVAPEVFANNIFAMKGGTAINLFVQNMPRLSVDIDVVYHPWQVQREEALNAINGELAAIAQRVAPLGMQARLVRRKDLGDTKLIVENEVSQVKIEVNAVFRGTVLPVESKPLTAETSDLFGVEFEAPILARDELYAGKLVAALDRQHPRDLFDVWQLYESGGLGDGIVECFVLYLAGHNRPPHEVLFGKLPTRISSLPTEFVEVRARVGLGAKRADLGEQGVDKGLSLPCVALAVLVEECDSDAYEMGYG